jgi:hypothetical protein
LTVASCLRGSITSSGAPAFTRSPARTRICVTCPSTSGCSTAALRDLSTAMYSVNCGTFCKLAACTFTAAA